MSLAAYSVAPAPSVIAPEVIHVAVRSVVPVLAGRSVVNSASVSPKIGSWNTQSLLEAWITAPSMALAKSSALLMRRDSLLRICSASPAPASMSRPVALEEADADVHDDPSSPKNQSFAGYPAPVSVPKSAVV
ncbi:hypothetical protein FJ656_18005 [Schumannella luteola]|nr:hypothetical protein FJ656_18005 [Schumannella luteola]